MLKKSIGLIQVGSKKYQKVVFHHIVYRDTRCEYKSHSCMEQTLVIVINYYQSR